MVSLYRPSFMNFSSQIYVHFWPSKKVMGNNKFWHVFVSSHKKIANVSLKKKNHEHAREYSIFEAKINWFSNWHLPSFFGHSKKQWKALFRAKFNYFSSLSLKQFFTVNDTPFPIAIVRKKCSAHFFDPLLLLPFSPDLSWAILHHPHQLNVCKNHSWFYYRGILSLHAHEPSTT